jgi:hypothetical protein
MRNFSEEERTVGDAKRIYELEKKIVKFHFLLLLYCV